MQCNKKNKKHCLGFSLIYFVVSIFLSLVTELCDILLTVKYIVVLAH